MPGIPHGVVKNGVIVPNAELPEGTIVEIRTVKLAASFGTEEQAEYDAWERASAGALSMVERLANEIDSGAQP